MTITASPLTWPDGWKRTPGHARKDARFGKTGHTEGYGDNKKYIGPRNLTIAEALKRVRDVLFKMNGGMTDDDIIISTNLRLRMDGLPRSDGGNPDDPGAAVYWEAGSTRKVIAVDQYYRVADNLAAIAATLDAMRAIERHGGAEILDRAFTGFVALPPPSGETWRDVLGFGAVMSTGLAPGRITPGDVISRYRELAAKNHPDRGGSTEKMAALNVARDAALEELKNNG